MKSLRLLPWCRKLALMETNYAEEEFLIQQGTNRLKGQTNPQNMGKKLYSFCWPVDSLGLISNISFVGICARDDRFRCNKSTRRWKYCKLSFYVLVMSSISPKLFGQKFPFRNWNFSQISTWLSGSKCSVVTLICFQTCVASSIKPYHQHQFPERYSRVLKLNWKVLREPETCSRNLLDK